LRDTNVYEPEIRARLGTSSHTCEVVVPKLRTVPIGTDLRSSVLNPETELSTLTKPYTPDPIIDPDTSKPKTNTRHQKPETRIRNKKPGTNPLNSKPDA
jgi:hypothetical protein